MSHSRLDIPTTGNMPNPLVEERREKQWQAVYKNELVLEDFRDRQPPPVIHKYKELTTQPFGGADICAID